MSEAKKSPLGQTLKRLRKKNGWRIADVSDMTGIAMSTISKVERGQMSLTYDKLTQLAHGLSLDISSLFAEEPEPQETAYVTARKSVGRAGEGVESNAGFYEYSFLAADLASKSMVPMMGSTSARSLEEFGEFVRHQGEEFLFVLEGIVEVHSEFYEPIQLHPGDYIYIDSSMGHAYVAASEKPPKFLAICTERTGSAGAKTGASRQPVKRHVASENHQEPNVALTFGEALERMRKASADG